MKCFYITKISTRLSCPCLLLSPVCVPGNCLPSSHPEKSKHDKHGMQVQSWSENFFGSVNFVDIKLTFLDVNSYSETQGLLRNSKICYTRSFVSGRGHEVGKLNLRPYILLSSDRLWNYPPPPHPSVDF